MSGYSGYGGTNAANIGSGISQEIVRILGEYRRPLPLDFVAQVLRRTPADLVTDLEPLQKRGVVKVEGDTVTLTMP